MEKILAIKKKNNVKLAFFYFTYTLIFCTVHLSVDRRFEIVNISSREVAKVIWDIWSIIIMIKRI